MKTIRSKTIMSLQRLALGLALLTGVDGVAIHFDAAFLSSDTAFARMVGRGGGGYRVASRTTVRPGGGVTHSTTVAAGRYHQGFVPGQTYIPGTAAGVARRTARRTTRRVAYRTAAGYAYYYGAPVVALPTPACYSVMWEGMAAYSCNGLIYIYQSGQYYPVEGE